MSSEPTPSHAGAPAPAWRVLLPAGVVELACLAAAGWWPGGAPASVLLPLLAVAFVAYAFAASRILRARGGHGTIWILAAAMRLALLPLAPALSHDVYRYLWDGLVQVGGINPYRFAPSDPMLAGLRTPWFALLPDATAISPYPPVAQIAFAALAMTGGAVLQAKLLWIALDLTTGWVLGRVAAFTGRSRRLTQLLYLWSPLLLVEVAWNGHMAPLALLGIALVVLLGRAPAAAGIAAAVASLAAWAPAAALAPLAARLGRRFLVAFGGALAVLTLPYVFAGRGLVEGLAHHFGEHRLFAGPFLLVESVAPGVTGSRVVAAVAVLAVVAWTAVQRFRPERALFWTLGAILLVTPAIRPWYALWILPLAALRVSRPWLLFTGTVLVAYAGVAGFRAEGTWTEPLWARLLIWLPFLALLVRDGLAAWRERFPEPAQAAG